jgi:uncharacterized Zn finger protein (UPF0148 family)
MTNRQCPKCYAVMRVGATVCPECGCTMEPKPRTVAEVEGELAEIDREQARQQRERRTEQGMAQSLEELIAIATKRGYKNPAWWAAKVLGSRPRRAA